MAYRLCLALLCWWCLCIASTAAAPQPQASAALWQQLHEQLEAQKKASDELKADNKDLQDRLKVQESALLETQRKNIDWWLSIIGVGLALFGVVIAVGGVLLPLYWQRSERSRLKEAQAEFERMKQAAEHALTNLQSHEKQGEEHLSKIAEASATAEKFSSGAVASGVQRSNNTEMQQAVQILANAHDPIGKLRAKAIKASQIEKPTKEQAKIAYELWNALALINPDEASAQLNAGYWAQQLQGLDVEGTDGWFHILCDHYAKALRLDSNKHEAANNWGNALGVKARAMAKVDLEEARRLWAQAGEKYAQALLIKPDKHQTAFNWGSMLDEEARALAKLDLKEARRLWAWAGEKFAQALRIKPDTYDAANNSGIALGHEAQVLAETDLVEARKLWAQAGEKFAQALRIKVDMHDAANNGGCVLHKEAQALAVTDLEEARKLWAQAGEKFAQALGLKSDLHDVANNWGIALGHEAKALAKTDLVEARTLWTRAGEKYAQALRIKKDKHEAVNSWVVDLLSEFNALCKIGQVVAAGGVLQRATDLLETQCTQYPDATPVLAYNLACCYALAGRTADALFQLELARQAGALPEHWAKDEDLAGIRRSPEYMQWVTAHFFKPNLRYETND